MLYGGYEDEYILSILLHKKHWEGAVILPKDAILLATGFPVGTLETASVDMYHFAYGTTHFIKSSHYHCYLLAFLFSITMVSSSA